MIIANLPDLVSASALDPCPWMPTTFAGIVTIFLLRFDRGSVFCWIDPIGRINAINTMNPTATDFRKAMGAFATGVTIITVDQDGDGEIHGMTANAFTSVSLDPPLILVCVDQRARTHAHLHARKRFGINVLSSGQRAISEYVCTLIRRIEIERASACRRGWRELRTDRARHASSARRARVS